MYCKNCGKENDDDSKFCRYCGFKINIKAFNDSNEKNKINSNLKLKKKNKILLGIIFLVLITSIVFIILKFENNQKSVYVQSDLNADTENSSNMIELTAMNNKQENIKINIDKEFVTNILYDDLNMIYKGWLTDAILDEKQPFYIKALYNTADNTFVSMIYYLGFHYENDDRLNYIVAIKCLDKLVMGFCGNEEYVYSNDSELFEKEYTIIEAIEKYKFPDGYALVNANVPGNVDYNAELTGLLKEKLNENKNIKDENVTKIDKYFKDLNNDKEAKVTLDNNDIDNNISNNFIGTNNNFKDNDNPSTITSNVSISLLSAKETYSENYELRICVNLDTNVDYKTIADSINVTINGVTANNNGSLIFNYPTTLNPGSNSFLVNITGNGISKSETYNVTYNLPDYSISAVGPTDLYGHYTELQITVKDNTTGLQTTDTGFTVMVNGIPVSSNSSEIYKYTVKEGETTFNIVVTDKYGRTFTKTIT